MRILAIETSCDETAIAIVEAAGGETSARFSLLGNALLSQVEIHQQYGGVFPALAKREHAKNLVPILEAALAEAELLREERQIIADEIRNQIERILEREPELGEPFLDFVSRSAPPAIDAIAVTAGPGLEPALWVGVNFAKALALAWEKPLVAVNHMEGHILAGLVTGTSEEFSISNLQFPVLALLISGGHTELVLTKEWLTYELVGQTRDDAVGEAFDKVARMLDLPYPGGPQISKLAEERRRDHADRSRLVAGTEGGEDQRVETPITLPRPMIGDDSCDFSFAGLKTAVLYMLKAMPEVSDTDKQRIAHEFENAVADVLWKKTSRALEQTGAQTLVVGGGVSANTHIRRVFTERIAAEHPHVELRIPAAALTADNAIMIAFAGYYRTLRDEVASDFAANGNLSLARR